VTRQQPIAAHAFTTRAQRWVVAGLFVAVSLLPSAGDFFNGTVPVDPYDSLVCVNANHCARPDLPEETHRTRLPAAVPKPDHVRRSVSAAQSLAVTDSASSYLTLRDGWRHPTTTVHIATQQRSLTRIGRGPPAAA
jgi:hypothetical protein